MILLANTEAAPGIPESIARLKRGDAVLDALVAGVSLVEADPDVRSVGFGGWPNLLGEMECDASVMHGTTRMVGAVGAVPETLHVAALAFAVMKNLPHVFLTGTGARRFADEIGIARADMLHPDSRQAWWDKLEPLVGDDFPNGPLAPYVSAITDPEKVRDTTVFLGSDTAGHLGTVTSTSGWAWKYPGRLGDSPVPGAGYYADSRYGACACTHTGEMTLRCGTAQAVVQGMAFGLSLKDAVARAAADLTSLDTGFLGEVVIHAFDTRNNHQVVHVGGTGPVHYWIWTEDMEKPALCVATQFQD